MRHGAIRTVSTSCQRVYDAMPNLNVDKSDLKFTFSPPSGSVGANRALFDIRVVGDLYYRVIAKRSHFRWQGLSWALRCEQRSLIPVAARTEEVPWVQGEEGETLLAGGL